MDENNAYNDKCDFRKDTNEKTVPLKKEERFHILIKTAAIV
jgi:hypothetical protein